MKVNLSDLWEVLQTFSKFKNTNSSYSGIAWQFQFLKLTNSCRVQLTDSEDSLVTDILTFDIKTVIIVAWQQVPKF